MSTIKKVEIFTLQMLPDGILRIHSEGDHIIDMRLYKVLIDAIGEMTEGKKVPILSITEELTVPDDEVRVYMANPDANPYCIANALIAPSLSQKIFVNFLMSITKRKIRMFKKEEEGIAWLRTFL